MSVGLRSWPLDFDTAAIEASNPDGGEVPEPSQAAPPRPAGGSKPAWSHQQVHCSADSIHAAGDLKTSAEGAPQDGGGAATSAAVGAGPAGCGSQSQKDVGRPSAEEGGSGTSGESGAHSKQISGSEGVGLPRKRSRGSGSAARSASLGPSGDATHVTFGDGARSAVACGGAVRCLESGM